MKKIKQKAFTGIEIVIVLAIMITLIANAPRLYATFFMSNELKMAEWSIEDVLTRARGNTMTGVNDKQWGVHFESDSYVLFFGSAYGPLDPDNEIHKLSSSISITIISINGGGSDVIFNRFTGDTDLYGSIVIENDTSGEMSVINVNEAGMIDVQ